MANLDETLLTDIRFDDDFVQQEDGGDIQTLSGLDNYKAAMIRRWITQPGTLAHRPLYGAGLKDFQNAVSSLDTQRKIATRINEQALRDNRTKEVTSVRMEVDDLTPQKTKIIVTLIPVGYEDSITIEFEPFGDG